MPSRHARLARVEVVRVGFGAWAINGAGWEGGWGSQDDAESIAAIERAPALGIDWIETAAVYGLGHSEEVVRRAPIANSLTRDSIRREVEASLSRLGVDAIDLYQIHWPNPQRGRTGCGRPGLRRPLA